MTAATQYPMSPVPPVAPHRSRAGLWIALGALAVGLVIAVLGVRAAVDSYQRDQEISTYAEARATAVWFVDNGETISPALVRMQELLDGDLALQRQTLEASYAEDVDRYNDLVDQLNASLDELESLEDQIEEFQDGFAREVPR